MSSTPKFEGGPARDPDGARVARRVEEIIRQRQNIVAFAILKGCNFERLVAGVSKPWLQAHPSDPVEPQSPLLVREKLLHRITRYHHPEQRSRRHLLPHASTTVTHSFLEMLWSVSELERAPNMPHRRHGLHFSVYAGVCGM